MHLPILKVAQNNTFESQPRSKDRIFKGIEDSWKLQPIEAVTFPVGHHRLPSLSQAGLVKVLHAAVHLRRLVTLPNSLPHHPGSVVFLPLVPVFLFIFTNFNANFWETPPPGLES